MHCVTDDLADAKRDDAADLLDVVAKNSQATRKLLKPGLPELFMLSAAWVFGRLPSLGSDKSGFSRSTLVIGAVVLLADAALWIRRRVNLGSEVGNRTWFYAGALFAWSILVGLDFDGDARQWALAGAFIFACVVIGGMHRSVVLLGMAAAMLIASATGIWPLVITLPIFPGYVALGYSFQKKVMGH
ncbi:MAG: hypothetical protein QOF21_3291 [Actinomycetota bacterium]